MEGWHTHVPFDLFLYLPMNRMFVTIGTEFFQFQSIRRIVSIFLSNISGNTWWFFSNTVSDTTFTFQNHFYSDIFTLGHKSPLDFWFTQLFYLVYWLFIFDPKRRKKQKKEVANSKSSFLKDFVAINEVIKKRISNTIFSNYPFCLIPVFHFISFI